MVATNLALLRVLQIRHTRYGHVTKGLKLMKKIVAIIFAASLSFGSVAITQTTTQADGPVKITPYGGQGSRCC
jgi:hypothetical protein